MRASLPPTGWLANLGLVEGGDERRAARGVALDRVAAALEARVAQPRRLARADGHRPGRARVKHRDDLLMVRGVADDELDAEEGGDLDELGRDAVVADR